MRADSKAIIDLMVRDIFGWKRMSQPRQLGDRIIVWQQYDTTSVDGSMRYHTEEEHARWVLKKEFDRG